MNDQTCRRIERRHRGWKIAVALVTLIIIPGDARAQTTSSSRPVSATVVSTYVARGGDLTLLVLWRGSPGWYSGGGGNSSSGGGGGSAGGREVDWFSMTFVDADWRRCRGRRGSANRVHAGSDDSDLSSGHRSVTARVGR